MNRITRLLAIAGMGVGAAVALAGPAQAATGDAGHRAPVTTKAHWGDGDRIVGYFDNPVTCERVGRIGEMRDRWDDYDCYRVRFGFHAGDWALSVSERGWNGDHGFHGHWFHGHGSPGGHDHGFPGGHDHGFPGGHDHGFPGGHDHGLPGGDDHGLPGGHDHGFPGGHDHGFPGGHDHGFPGHGPFHPAAQS